MKKKIKVLFVSHFGGLNGAPRSMLDIIQGLDKKRFYPIVVMPASGPLKEELRNLRIKYYFIPFKFNYRIKGDRHYIQELKDELYNYKAINEIVNLIKIQHVDIVHSNTSVMDVGAMAAWLARVPHVFHVRELMEEDFGFEYVHKCKMKWLLQRSDAVIAISRCVYNKVQRSYGVNPTLLYNGIVKERYWHKINPILQQDTIQLLLCGQICEAKGQIDAVCAVAKLKERGYVNIRLTLIGQGNELYMQKLTDLIHEKNLENNIAILPFCKDLASLREQTDISLTCSRMEALGRVTAEAMLAGNCVVGADTGGTKELIGKQQKYGYLYRAGDSESLADTLEQVFHNVEEAKKKMVAAQKMISEKIDLDHYIEALSALYENVLADKKGMYTKTGKT